MRVSLGQAQETIAAALMPLRVAVENLGLVEALGRFLAEDVVIGHALPPFAASAMDGYAFRHADLGPAMELQLIGESRAGQGFAGDWMPGACVRISTGAPVPHPCDTVVIQENTERQGESIRVTAPPALGANVRPAGDECAAGTRLLERGERLTARKLALAATAGRARLRVHAQPRVAILATGDELAAGGSNLRPGQIYESNGAMLQSLVREAGGLPLPPATVADEPDALLAALERLAAAADLILTSGGASVGDHDHLPALLLREGSLHFWKVQLKPGMPAIFGEFRSTPILALPGNPVSAYVTFHKLAWPALRALQGLPPPSPRLWRGRLKAPLRKAHERAEYRRARHSFDADGQLWIEPIGTPDSHRIRALSIASVLVPMPEGNVNWEVGTVVEVEPIEEWLA